jgi:IS5 family transposase
MRGPSPGAVSQHDADGSSVVRVGSVDCACYPKADNGRQPAGLTIMLRIYFLQHWLDLSDPGAEDALYESAVPRRFAGFDLGRAAAPDETTLLNFRYLLEQNQLCGKILDSVNLYLASKGIRISTGTIVREGLAHGRNAGRRDGHGPCAPSARRTEGGSARGQADLPKRKPDLKKIWPQVKVAGCAAQGLLRPAWG